MRGPSGTILPQEYTDFNEAMEAVRTAEKHFMSTYVLPQWRKELGHKIVIESDVMTIDESSPTVETMKREQMELIDSINGFIRLVEITIPNNPRGKLEVENARSILSRIGR